MNREQMVESLAQMFAEFDQCDAPDDSDYARARMALSAVLPQVTTVAELEALPVETLVITADGFPYTPGPPGYVVSEAYGHQHLDEVQMPLTVVWTPEVPA